MNTRIPVLLEHKLLQLQNSSKAVLKTTIHSYLTSVTPLVAYC